MSVVYFIQSGTDGPVKVGFANSVAPRLTELQCGNPEPLTLLATVPGTRKNEKSLHRLLYRHHLRGEWYKFEYPFTKLIEEVQGGLSADEAIERATYHRDRWYEATRGFHRGMLALYNNEQREALACLYDRIALSAVVKEAEAA